MSGGRIEGRRAVLEALRAGSDLKRIEIARGMRPDPALDEIRRAAALQGVPVREVARADLDALSERGHHQGVAAVTWGFRYRAFREVLEAARGKKDSVLVVLDHVTDPGNLGAIARSAECAGADALVIAERRAAPVTAVVHKAAAGALAHLPVAQVTNLSRAIAEIKEAGYWVIGAAAEAPADMWSAPLDGRVALVLGSEGSGLSRLVAESCDLLVSIPLRGRVGSLNVAQAATLLLYEHLRRSSGSQR